MWTFAVKYHLRRYGETWDEMDLQEIGLMRVCLEAVTAEKARGWYVHSGYL